MATTNLGRVIPLHKGAYSATTPYELNDIVSLNGSLYWHHSDNVTTGVSPSDTTVWTAVLNLSVAESYIARAETAATSAESGSRDSEAWAVGKRDGVDVPSTDPAYHNNAKYYAMLEANKVVANIVSNQSITLAQVKAILDEINANHEHVFFDVSALGASMYLCTIYIDDEKYKIFDLVSGRYTEGAYDGTRLLTMCLVNAESVATQSQIDHLQDEINELGGIEKIKDWDQLGDLILSGESTTLISAGDTIDVNWIKSVIGSTTHGLTVSCSDIETFANAVDEAEAKEYFFVYDGSAWTYNDEQIDLADFALSVTGSPVSGEVMTIRTTIAAESYTFTGYDDFTPADSNVTHNWCLESTYAPTTKAYDTHEALFVLAEGKTLPAGNYKIHAPYYGGSTMIDVYVTIPQAYTATGAKLQFASTGYQAAACIPGDSSTYYIASAVRPSYINTIDYVGAAINVLYNQTGSWTDISTVDGVTATESHVQAALGNNCPAYCNLRQWLNDDSKNGNYAATHDFDRPSAYNFQTGFLYGIDPRVKRLIQLCKTKFEAGYDNGEYSRGTVYENEDKVFLLSMKEMSFDIQTGEGNATDLYSKYTDNVLTNGEVAARAKYNKAGGSLNSYRWSRSCYSWIAYHARHVTAAGSGDSRIAFGGNCVAPAFIIGKSTNPTA